MYFILIVLVVIGLVGLFKSMDKSERAVVLRGGLDVVKATSAYSVTIAKDTGKLAYQSGEYLGKSVSLEHQESLDSISKFSTDINTKGGAVKVGVKVAKDHLDVVGIDGWNKDLKTANNALEAALTAARSNRPAAE